MWILTPVGFFSIVRKPEDRYRGTLTVRARVRDDLEALRDRYLPTLEAIDDDPERDYRFRATAPRGDVTAALAQLAEEIDYDDFKSTVASRQGYARAKVYGDVWWTLRDLQDDPAFAAPHEAADSHGGVVVSGGGKILLRAPSKAHGGYAWTFAKTAAEDHETPQETALRAVREKTGYAATIRIAIPGVFEGSGRGDPAARNDRSTRKTDIRKTCCPWMRGPPRITVVQVSQARRETVRSVRPSAAPAPHPSNRELRPW